MTNSVNPYGSRSKYTGAYNKKAMQTGYSQKGDSVDGTPLPFSEQEKPFDNPKSKPVREGLDPRMFNRETKSPVSLGTQEKALFTSVYPWHLVPRYTSANVIQRQQHNFVTTNLPTNQYLDVLVLNVSRAIGSAASVTPVAIPSTAPVVPTQTLSSAGEAMSGSVPWSASNNRFPTGSGGTLNAAPAASLMSPGSSGDFYKITSFGHSEASATAGVTYQIWVDGRLMMEWADFQWSPVTPRRDQWDFEVPLFIEQQIVFRVINETGVTINTGTMESAFVGWSEQKMGFLETDKIQLETVG
jgi:hypothetical protein